MIWLLVIIYMSIGYFFGGFKHDVWNNRHTQPKWKLYLLWPVIIGRVDESTERDPDCLLISQMTKKNYSLLMAFLWFVFIISDLIVLLICGILTPIFILIEKFT
jgi:hypothetical protein